MSAIAVFNLILLFYCSKRLKKRLPKLGDLVGGFRRKQLFFSAIYVIGCAFRSFVPASQIKRTGLIDFWITSSGMSRSVATIAELAFVIQWALLLREISKSTNDQRILFLSSMIVPVIAVAEVFSWYTCVTTNYIGTTIEESLWAVAATLTLIGFTLAYPKYSGAQRAFLTAGIIACVGYICYMVFVDVPAYLANWQAAEAAGKSYLSIGEGIRDCFTVWHQTRSYELWKYEMLWMTLYFSVAVWGSLCIIVAPAMDRGLKPK